MHNRSFRSTLPTTVLTLALSTMASSAFAQSLTIGGPGDGNNGNSFPFGNSVLTYQQVYAASDFSGPIDINGLTFFNTRFGAGSIQTATYTVELSTTSAAVNGLSNTFASNLGGDNATVFVGTLSGSATPNFTIPTSLFNYQPANGNLLLTILKTNITGPTGSVFLDARNGTAAGLFSRKYSLSSTTTADNAGFDNDWGLVTQIDFTSSAVPEPGSLALFVGVGVTGLGFLVRRRKQARTAA